MINLVKKDLRACFKADLKTIIKLVIGILIFSLLLVHISMIAIPLFVSYIFIFRSFYLDEQNKMDYFFNSMPIDKEDVVYGKYIFSMIIIILSLIFSLLYSKVLKGFWYVDLFNVESALVALSMVLLLISICMPIAFKYGYNRSYIIINLIMVAMGFLTMFTMFAPKSKQWVEDQIPRLIEPKYLIAVGISLVLYVISMYISRKIYLKKEIAS